MWCCLLPWMNKNADPITETDAAETKEPETLVDVSTTPPPSTTISRSTSKEEDETSIGSDAFGERLSEKDRQAVLARLRLAQPDEVTNGDNSPTNNNGGDAPSSPDQVNNGNQKGLLNGISLPPPEVDCDDAEHEEAVVNSSSRAKPPRGILRQHSRMSRNSLAASGGGANKQTPGEAARRRSLFPNYSESTPNKNKDMHVNFSPMARVLSVKSHKDMEGDEKGGVWWQKSDYEEFRKTGRMITKAMLEGGSEIWLATNRSWQVPNQNRSTTLKHATSLAERQAAKQNKSGSSNLSKKEYENTRDKWWHKFGHSRRGLEHIASIDEGRQRQGNVKRAIRAVVEENKRQKAFFREDADKLRMVSLQNTTWARDLALAAGASDADAVHTNFNDESRKSREFYLLKISRAQQQSHSNNLAAAKKAPKTVPAFMRPATSLQVQPNRLDANTISQIRYRQTTNKNKKKLVSVAASSSSSSSNHQPRRTSTTSSTSSSSSTNNNNNNKEHAATTTTNATATHATSMAKKAAGFASGEEVANMSAVLTGMGPLPKNVTMVGGA
mmetsp:Transcript_9860/g.23247  ORF Transcript_9860/g.23247 Transcript_9860/m.23247 type:complete len:556 (-) Transcript_9860:319-1986(-)